MKSSEIREDLPVFDLNEGLLSEAAAEFNVEPAVVQHRSVIPVVILTGFLGSGKTTLLVRLIEHYRAKGLRPALIMNEIGEVNLDGMLVRDDVPMAEMLGGCICCSVRGDFAFALFELVRKEAPDIVLIESTGIANPMEILDGITEVTLSLPVEVRSVITMVDTPQFLESFRKGVENKTLRLMREQIRCATLLIANKTDLLRKEEVLEAAAALTQINPHARQITASYGAFDLALLEGGADREQSIPESESGHGCDCDDTAGSGHGDCGNHVNHSDCCDHAHAHHNPDQPSGERAHHAHGSHDAHDVHGVHGVHRSHDVHDTHSHVMALTYYLNRPVDSREFEEMIRRLPDSVYRGKGVLRLSDTASLFLFQYAYKQLEFTKLDESVEVPGVIVLIGEQMPREQIMAELEKL